MRSKQAPIHSGYGEETTAREALNGRDLIGVVALVTGGHAGIGLETTRALAGAGATYKTTEQGAATSVWCATSSQLDDMGGVYCEDADIATPSPPTRPSSAACVRGRRTPTRPSGSGERARGGRG